MKSVGCLIKAFAYGIVVLSIILCLWETLPTIIKAALIIGFIVVIIKNILNKGV